MQCKCGMMQFCETLIHMEKNYWRNSGDTLWQKVNLIDIFHLTFDIFHFTINIFHLTTKIFHLTFYSCDILHRYCLCDLERLLWNQLHQWAEWKLKNLRVDLYWRIITVRAPVVAYKDLPNMFWCRNPVKPDPAPAREESAARV